MPVKADNNVWINEFWDGGGTFRRYELAGPPGADISGWFVDQYRWSSGALSFLSTTTIAAGTTIGSNGTWVGSNTNDLCRALCLRDPAGAVVEFIYFAHDTTGAATNPTTGPAAGLTPDKPAYISGPYNASTKPSRARKGTGDKRTDHTVWEYQASTLSAVNTGQSLVPPDTTAPSTPTGLATTATSMTSADLTWTASTDNVAVTGYRVRRDGTLIGSPTATTFADAGLTQGTTYAYAVSAVDAAGNESGAATLSVTTPAPDTTPPSVPTGLTVTGVTTSTVTLEWAASTDNVEVAEYRLYRGGVLLDSTTDLTYTDAGLTASTPHSYTLSAADGQGNESAQTAQVFGITLAEPPPPPEPTGPPPVGYPPYTPDGIDVVDFLGQTGDTQLTVLADKHAEVIAQMVRAYTRGGGHNTSGIPNNELSAVIITATARLLANPEQLDTTVGGVRTGQGFSGWTLAELFVLNRYRRRAR